MEFFRHEGRYCVRAEMGIDFIVLRLALDAERVRDPYVRQVPYLPCTLPIPVEEVRDAVIAAAADANRTFGTSLWPLSIDFQLERVATGTRTLDRFTREIYLRLVEQGESGYVGWE